MLSRGFVLFALKHFVISPSCLARLVLCGCAMLEDDFIKEFEDLFAEDQAASDPSEQQAAPPPPAPAAAAVQAAASAASSSSAALLEDLDLFVKEQAAAPAGLPASPAPPPVAAAASAVEAAAAAGSSSGAVSEQATQLAEASKQAGREKRRPSSPEKGQTGQTGKQQQTTPVRRCRLCHAQAGNRKCKQCLLPVCCACSPTMQTLRILVPGSDDTFRQSKGYVCRPCAESLAASPSCLSPLLPPSADVSPAKADPPSPSTSASSGAASSSSSAASSPLKQEGAGSPPSRTGAVLSHSRSSSSVASSSSSPRRRKRRPAPASAGHERKLDLSMSAPQLCVLQDGGCTRNGGEEDGGASRLLDCLITGDHAALLAQLQTERDEPLCRHLPTTLMKRASRSDLVSQTLLWMSRAGTALPCMALSQPLLEDQSNAASPNLASPRASLPAGSEAPSHSPLLWEPFLRPERDQSIVFFAQLNDKEVCANACVHPMMNVRDDAWMPCCICVVFFPQHAHNQQYSSMYGRGQEHHCVPVRPAGASRFRQGRHGHQDVHLQGAAAAADCGVRPGGKRTGRE
eukprot:g10132.t1